MEYRAAGVVEMGEDEVEEWRGEELKVCGVCLAGFQDLQEGESSTGYRGRILGFPANGGRRGGCGSTVYFIRGVICYGNDSNLHQSSEVACTSDYAHIGQTGRTGGRMASVGIDLRHGLEE
jgi:hypothetical protein